MEGGTIADCKSLFNCLAKDASVLEDRRMSWTVGSLRERCSVGVGRDQKCSDVSVMQTDLGGSEDTTRGSPAQDPSLSTFFLTS